VWNHAGIVQAVMISQEPIQSTHLETIMGKLKSIFPTLYYSLTSWEKNVLDSSSSFGLQGGNKYISDSCRV
jgi:hypothetical protein